MVEEIGSIHQSLNCMLYLSIKILMHRGLGPGREQESVLSKLYVPMCPMQCGLLGQPNSISALKSYF